MAGALIAVGPERGLAVCLPVGLLAYVSLLALFRGIPQDALPSWLSLLPQQVRRVWHFRVGPSAARLAEARTRLSGRKYYKLYDDMYREIQQHGGSRERESEIARTRQLIDADFARLRVEGLLPGPGAELIDLGCGAGSNALLFAGLGFRVTGVDVSPTAIAAAAGLAADQNVQIGFKVEDVVQLAGLEDHSFDVATDIGCLHMLVRREDRRSYMRSVRRVLRPGGVWFLLNKVSERDVVIEEEEEYILRRTAWSEKRWMGNDGARVTCGGCGFRSASVRQYQEELRAAGFEVLRSSRLRDYAALLARAP
jgi:2-polyprenyl-3-methyl-5-hydroxy-6-metoxy-1,4-benzoquinol methylase